MIENPREKIVFYSRTIGTALMIHFIVVLLTVMLKVILSTCFGSLTDYFYELSSPIYVGISIFFYIICGFLFYKGIEKRTYFAVFSLFWIFLLLFGGCCLVWLEAVIFLNPVFFVFLDSVYPLDLEIQVIVISVLPSSLISCGLLLRGIVLNKRK